MPSTFPQNRLKLDISGLNDVSDTFAELLEGLLEPLPEDRLTANQAKEVIFDNKFKRYLIFNKL